MIRGRKLFILIGLGAVGLLLGYLYASLSYDFENYVDYVSHPKSTAVRFAFEPGFVLLSSFLFEVTGNGRIATRFLYALSFLSLIIGVVVFAYAVRSSLKIRSLFIIPVCVLAALPLMALIAIVPRQCFAAGFSFMAMAAYVRAFSSDQGLPVKSRLQVALFFLISLMFHSLSTIMAFALFAWLFLRWKTLLILAVLGGVAALALFFLSGGQIDVVLPMIGSAMVYFSQTGKETGTYRLGVFFLVSFLFMLTVRPSTLRSGIFGGNIRVRMGLLIFLSALVYLAVSPDIVRALYYPTLVIWLFIGISAIKKTSLASRLCVT